MVRTDAQDTELLRIARRRLAEAKAQLEARDERAGLPEQNAVAAWSFIVAELERVAE